MKRIRRRNPRNNISSTLNSLVESRVRQINARTLSQYRGYLKDLVDDDNFWVNAQTIVTVSRHLNVTADFYNA